MIFLPLVRCQLLRPSYSCLDRVFRNSFRKAGAVAFTSARETISLWSVPGFTTLTERAVFNAFEIGFSFILLPSDQETPEWQFELKSSLSRVPSSLVFPTVPNPVL
jgi:hypothetical protein